MILLRASERFSHVAPLGVRFVDDQTGRVIGDGLSATAWPSLDPGRVVPLRQNGSNVHVLLGAPGLGDLERGEGDDEYWNGLPRRIDFTVEVEDLRGRFLGARFPATLPLRGLMRLGCGSPPSPVPLPPGAEADGVPLFTAPARPPTPGRVVVRADLWDAANHVPAAWAMLEARTPGARLRGEPPARALADHRGRVALHLPFPDDRDVDGGSFDSPAGPGGAPLAARTWTVEIDAAYGALAAAPKTAARLAPPIPDLCAALAQPPARLWERLGGAPVPMHLVSLRFGQETILKSSAGGGHPPSVLLLTSSQSPP